MYWQAVSGVSFDAMRLCVEELGMQSYPVSALLSRIHDRVVDNKVLSDVNKALICEKIAKVLNTIKLVNSLLNLLLWYTILYYIVDGSVSC